MNAFAEGIITIVLAVVGIAALSIILSKNSQTSNVIQSSASGLGNLLGVAESPVTGASITYSTAYPTSSSGYGFGS
jgi:type II secretory pathway pseudopilin PulG